MLKDKAKKSSGGALSQKAQSRGVGTGNTNPDLEKDPQENTNMTMPGISNQPPPPPPPLMYLRYFATIPALRSQNKGM